ncbi:hypothetical protein WJX72_008614 [[Myrmecia] bisecta]|uniref:Uncharacterized protein n=1 Tax=[Myrmecia] bisecta TaxID=41462 RepID=A0AAW1QRY4_9CHLO
MNNNKNDETALLAGCKGVFSKTSYIGIGNKDKPEPFVHKLPERDGFKGKQMVTVTTKTGRTPDTFFEKKHLYVSEGAPYLDRLKYQDTQKVKKKGFCTSDYSRRDEFSMTFRTEQYRQLLKQEDKFAKRALEMLSTADKDGTTTYLTASLQPAQEHQDEDPVFLYDLVYEKEDNHKSGASKVSRDTKNPTMLSHERKFGKYRTTTRIAHTAPEEFSKPEYARRPLIRDTFYRRTNVFQPIEA